MSMRSLFCLCFSICICSFVNGQVETGSSIKIDRESDLKASKFDLSTGLETPKSDSKITLYSLPKELSEYGRPKRPFNMNGDDGFFKPNTEITPKWFKKDKAIKDEFKSDQYLGDFKSSGKFVHLVYRDHEHVDGDQVRIFINDDVIRSKIYLSSAFQGIKINLTKGFNKIDIQALNQGESGPNTAEFQLYDDQGVLITGNEWNLTTGVKATMIVVKE